MFIILYHIHSFFLSCVYYECNVYLNLPCHIDSLLHFQSKCHRPAVSLYVHQYLRKSFYSNVLEKCYCFKCCCFYGQVCNCNCIVIVIVVGGKVGNSCVLCLLSSPFFCFFVFCCWCFTPPASGGRFYDPF